MTRSTRRTKHWLRLELMSPVITHMKVHMDLLKATVNYPGNTPDIIDKTRSTLTFFISDWRRAIILCNRVQTVFNLYESI